MLQRAELFRLSTNNQPPLHLSNCFRLRTTIDADILQRALNQVIKRHAGLRAAFFGSPTMSADDKRTALLKASATHLFVEHVYSQSIVRDASLTLEVQTVTATAPERRRDEVRDLVEASHSKPFDLEHPPLMRAVLIRCGSDDYYFLLVVHHLLTDIWSQRLLRKDLAHFYDCFIHAKEPALPELSTCYPEFAEWQREHLLMGPFSESVEYWKRNWLALEREQIAAGDFPARSKSDDGSAFSGYSELRLDPVLSQRVKDSARHAKVSLYVTLLTGFIAVLHCWSRKPLVVTRINVANRVRQETYDLVGFVANTHFIAIDVSSDPSGQQLTQQVNRAVFKALQHQEVPVCLAWRSLGRPPIVSRLRILFDLVSTSNRAEASNESAMLSYLRPLPMYDILTPKGSSNLQVIAVDSDEGLLLTGAFSQNGWTPSVMNTFLADYRRILQAWTLQRDLPLSALSAKLS